jgi:glycosyltransferase involved in cell wall biosynthesis
VNLLLLNFEYPPLGGGGGVSMALLAEALARRNRVTVLTSRAGDLPAVVESGGLKVVRVPVLGRRRAATASVVSMASYLPTAAWKGLALAGGTRYAVINSHFVVPTGVAGDFVAQRTGVPHVITVHGGDLYDPSKWLSPHRHASLRWSIRTLLRRSKLVIGQSQNTLHNLETFYGNLAPVERIPLGIPHREAPARDRASLGWPESAKVLLTVSRLVARKGIDQLVQTMRDLGRTDALLAIVGTGPEEGALRSLAEELGVADRVRFMGWLSEEQKYTALASADVFVSTSQHEGFGLMFLEALCCGLPIVCYDEGGQTDFLQDGVTGGVARVNDRAGFAAAVGRLVSDPALHARIARHNRECFESLTIERCAERYENAFERVLRGVNS